MNSNHIIFFFAFGVLLIVLNNYQQQQQLPTAAQCDSSKNICVACPHLNINLDNNPFKKYIQISLQSEFLVLGAYHYQIRNNQCKQLLQVISKDRQGSWYFVNQLAQDIKNKKMVLIKSEEVSLAEGQGHHLSVSHLSDMVVFYEGVGYKHPQFKVEQQVNSLFLMKVSRIMCWSMIFALLLKYIDSVCGFIFRTSDYGFAWSQLLIIGCMVWHSYQPSDFAQLFIVQIMYLAYLLDVLQNVLKIKRQISFGFLLIIFALAWFIYQQLVILGYISLISCIKARNSKLKNSSAQIQVVTAFILICSVSTFLQIVSSINFFNYAAYATKIVSIPFTLMIYQPRQVLIKQTGGREGEV